MELDDENKVARQRKFYLFMSPFDGHELAEQHGKFTMPSPDIIEAEMKDVLKIWMSVQQSTLGTVLSDSAWWMLRILDPEGRMGADESMKTLDGLTSFGMSILGQLLDLKLISMSESVDLPQIVTSSEFQFSDEDFQVLKQLELLWEDSEDDE